MMYRTIEKRHFGMQNALPTIDAETFSNPISSIAWLKNKKPDFLRSYNSISQSKISVHLNG